MQLEWKEIVIVRALQGRLEGATFFLLGFRLAREFERISALQNRLNLEFL